MADISIERWAMLDSSTGLVTNVCNWDGLLTTWQPPVGITMVKAPDNVGIGWTHNFDTGVWAEPVIT